MGMAALRRLAEPALRHRAVRRHVVAAAMQRAHREHRADMALLGRLARTAERGRVVARAAAAVHHHLAERHLGIDHADLGGARDPGAALLRVGLQAAALDQHAAVPVLRVHHAVRGAAQPVRRLAVVALDADALGQADAEIERRHQIARPGGLLEPLARAREIGLDAARRARDWRGRRARPSCRPRRSAEPARRLLRIARHAGTGQIQHAERARRMGCPASAARRNQIAASA